jgi:hypothetical protein
MDIAPLALAIGIFLSSASALVMWLAAKRVRSAEASGPWCSDWSATLISLALTGSLVVAFSWTVKGCIALVDDAMVGVAIGFVVCIATLTVTLRSLGPLPR